MVSFEELHGKGGSDTNVGVDLTTLMTSMVAVSTAGGGGDGAGAGGSDLTVPRIASFQVYWDVQAKQFKVFSPKVVTPSGSEITVEETTLSRGTYVCEVKKNQATGAYTAAIKLTDAIVPSAETVAVVKLFKIEDGKVEQYHVGEIMLGESAPFPWKLKVENGARYVYSPLVSVGGGEYYAVGYGDGWNDLEVSEDTVRAYVYVNRYGHFECKINDEPEHYAYSFEVGGFIGDDVEQYVFGMPVLSDVFNADNLSVEIDEEKNSLKLKGFDNDESSVDTTLAEELQADEGEEKFDGDILVRSTGGTEKKLKYMPIGKLQGGYEGIDRELTFLTGIRYDDGWIQIKTKTITFENGIATEEEDETDWENTIETTPHSGEHGGSGGGTTA